MANLSSVLYTSLLALWYNNDVATYTPEQVEKALETLPEELKDALFSMETAQHVWDIREKYKAMDEKGDKIPSYVGYVLMGLMLPQEFEQALVKEIKLPKKAAQEVAREINRFVFYPVKPSIEQLHSTSIGTAAPQKTSYKEPAQEVEEVEKPSGPDAYQEPIE